MDSARAARKQTSTRNAARAEALAEISRVLAEAQLDYQGVLNTIVRRVAELLEGVCVLRLLSDDRQYLLPAAVYHPDPEVLPVVRDLLASAPHRVDEGLSARVMQTGEALLMSAVSPEELRASAKAEYALYLERYGISSLVLVPLRAQGRVIGTLGLSRDTPGRPYTIDDQSFLQDLADRGALAITSARLHADNLRKLEVLTTLYAGAQKLSHSLDLQKVADDVTRIYVEVFGCSLAWLGRAEPDGRVSLLTHYPKHIQYPLHLRVRWDDTPEGRWLTGPAIRSGFPKVLSEVAELPAADPLRERLLAQGFHSAGAFALISRDHPFGSLALYSDRPGFFTPERIELFQAYAHQAAAALENARLFAETERRLRYLSALRTVDMAITGSLELRVTLNVILDQVTTQLGVDAADVLLLNTPAQTLEFAAGRGFRTRALQHTLLRLGQGYAGRAAMERRIITVPDLRGAPDVFERSPLLPHEEFVAYYAAPLLAKGQAKGVLEIFHRAPLTPDPDWLDFLEALAGQAAIAIDSATLFDELQRANASLIEAYDATLEGWVRTLDLRDRETEGHTQRVTELTLRLARALGMPQEEIVHIRRGALLHDIGKMAMSDTILLKPGSLTDEERAIMQQHPVHAYELLSVVPYLHSALDIPYCHHERWDGTGYPRKLKGEEIPLAARIFAVVDVWDALRSDRPYRRACSREEALAYIRGEAGKHFDPRAVEEFIRLLEEEADGNSGSPHTPTMPA